MGDAEVPVHLGSYDQQKLNDILKPNPYPNLHTLTPTMNHYIY